MHSDSTARSARAQGIRFFLAWFLVGGFVGLLTFVFLMFAAMGGVWTPPGVWLFFLSIGTLVLPIMLALGGLPAAIQIAQGQATWKRTARISLAVCVTSWVVVVGVVFLGPSVFGWSW